jgi:hypothetical protein
MPKMEHVTRDVTRDVTRVVKRGVRLETSAL